MNENPFVRVLVVEDEPSVRHSLSGFLEDYKFEVLAAESAEKALELLAIGPCHVAIVDIRLPGMNGDAMILQAHEITPEMRFLIYTGSADYNLPEDLKHIGIGYEHVFFKPQKDLSVFVKAIFDLLGEGEEHNGKY